MAPLPTWLTPHSLFCGPDFLSGLLDRGVAGGWGTSPHPTWCGRLVLPKLVSWLPLCSLVSVDYSLGNGSFLGPQLRAPHLGFGFLFLSCPQSRRPDLVLSLLPDHLL